MIKNAHNKIRNQLNLVLFMCAILLSVQVATLNHSTEHQFHKKQDLCSSFLVYEHNATTLSFFGIPISNEVIHEKITLEVSHSQQQLIVYRSIRAPPVLTPYV